jgi:GPH family glycoside/pentoside/hexuronide:cation symporter
LPGTYPGNPTEGQAMKFLQLMMGYVLFDTMLTIVILSLVALPPEMTESTSERATFSLFQTAFGAVGGALIFLVPSIVYLGWDTFRVYVVIIAIIAMCSFITLSFGVKERKKLYEKQKYDQNLLKEMILTLKNRSFISFLIFNFTVSFLQTLAISFTPFYSLIVGLENDTLVLFSFYIGNGIAIPTYTYLAKKIELSKIIVISALICLTIILSLYFVDIIFNVTFVYFIIFTFIGLLYGTSILYYPYIGNCIDQDELKTNRRREGMHFGVNALLSKSGESGPAILGAAILSITGYIQGGSIAEQPISAINGLKFLITIIPVIFAIICILSQFINPLKGETLKKMKQDVMALHKLKEGKDEDLNKKVEKN